MRNGQSSHTLQNPGDPGAGYDGRKGPGSKVQLAQTSEESNPVQLITACLPQSAGDHDSAALQPMLEQLSASELSPRIPSAGSHCGSVGNPQHASSAGIELISPITGRTPQSEKSPHEPGMSAPPKKYGRRQRNTPAEAQQRAARLARRRQEQQSEEWQAKHRRRAGIEGTNRGIDGRTGIKRLRARGMAAAKHAVHGKIMGWNIQQGPPTR